MNTYEDNDILSLYYADGYADACEGNEAGTNWHGDEDTPESMYEAYDAGYKDGSG